MGMYLEIYAHDDLDDLRTEEACDAWLEDAEVEVDVGKAWDLLGRVVSGGPEGLFGFGEALNTMDLGYGPPTGIWGADLERLQRRLDGLDDDAVREAIREIDDAPYPFHGGIPADEHDELDGWILPLVHELTQLTRRTVKDDGVLVLVLA